MSTLRTSVKLTLVQTQTLKRLIINNLMVKRVSQPLSSKHTIVIIMSQLEIIRLLVQINKVLLVPIRNNCAITHSTMINSSKAIT